MPKPLSPVSFLKRPRTNRERQRLRRWNDYLSMELSADQFTAWKNPIDAWEAYLWARKARIAPPDSVLAYFDRVAARLSGMGRDRVPRKGEPARAVYEALEMKQAGRTGAANPFRAFSDTLHETAIAAEVFLAIARGAKPDIAYDEVVRDHPKCCLECKTISRSTVINYWKRFNERVAAMELAQLSRQISRRLKCTSSS